MRAATFNVNGIRAAHRRGFASWLETGDADVVALQEVRCRPEDLPDNAFGDYHVAYDPGQQAGRNGVALLTRRPPARVFTWTADNPWSNQGRLIGVDLAEVPVTVLSVYVPKGGLPRQIAPADGGRESYTPAQNHARYQNKMAFLAHFAAELDALAAAAEAGGRSLLVMGDYNIAHGPADIHNWAGNLASEGFLPGERAWLDGAIGLAASRDRLRGRRIVAPNKRWRRLDHPLVDVVRSLHVDADGPYSWWSWQGQAFAKDVGWRIDYQLASPPLAITATRAWVDRAAAAEQRVSDHAAVVVDYAI